MATVYLALQESLQREVVLKVMNAQQSENKDFTERFLNEGRIVAALRHPHIITIFDIGHAGELVYIAMEYVEGGDLKGRTGDRFTPDEAFDLVTKIGGALDYAHENGIIHRDVKPANILFRDDGTALLSDFGIAKQIAVDSELTSTGTILGSPFYMSPEQAEGLVVDGRTDIYSLGVIFYEMLTGDRPYQGDSAIKVIMQHIQSPLPELPKDLQEYQPLLARIMAKDREDRAPDAATMLKEVEAFQGQGEDAENTVAALKANLPVFVAPAPRNSWLGDVATPRVIGLLAVMAVLIALFMGFYVYVQDLKPTTTIAARSSQVHAPTTNSSVVELSGLNAPATLPGSGSGRTLKKSEVTKALEWLAKNSIREDRLTHPPAENAYYYFSRLLALDPDNAAARDGFREIAERFVVLAELEFSKSNYSQAQTYIALGLQVEPANKGLITLRGFMDQRKKSFLDTVLEMFNS